MAINPSYVGSASKSIADYVLRLLIGMSLSITLFGLWKMHNEDGGRGNPKEYWFTTITESDGSRRTSAIPVFGQACERLGKHSGGRFVESHLHNGKPVVYIGVANARDDDELCKKIADASSRQGILVRYSPCESEGHACTVAAGGLASNGRKNTQIRAEAFRYRPGSLLFGAGTIMAAFALLASIATRRRDGDPRPSPEFRGGSVLGIMVGLSGLLWMRFVIATNTVVHQPGMASSVYLTGIEWLVIPACAGLLIRRHRANWLLLIATLLAASAWTWIALIDPLVGHTTRIRFSEAGQLVGLLLTDWGQLLLKLKTNAGPFLIQLLLPVVLLSAVPVGWRLSKADSLRLRSLLSKVQSPCYLFSAILIGALMAFSAAMSVYGGTGGNTLDKLPFLPMIATVGSMCYAALAMRAIPRASVSLAAGSQQQSPSFLSRLAAKASFLPVALASIVCVFVFVGGFAYDFGTTSVASICLLFGMAVSRPDRGAFDTTSSAGNGRIWNATRKSWRNWAAIFAFAVATFAVGLKGYYAFEMNRSLAEEGRRNAETRYDRLAARMASHDLALALNRCSVADDAEGSDEGIVTAERAKSIDACYLSENFRPLPNRWGLYDPQEFFNERTRLYVWLLGQPLDRVWPQTSIENMGGYMQGLANAVPTPGKSQLFGDRRIPNAVELGPRNIKDGLAYEWLTGVSLLRPLGWIAALFVMCCYALIYRSIDRANASGRVFIAALGAATFWAFAQTQGLLPLTGFSAPLLTFTSLARDFLPNILGLLVLLLVHGMCRLQEYAR